MRIPGWEIERLTVFQRDFDVEAMARAHQVSVEAMKHLFRDARTGSRVAPQWVADAFGYWILSDNQGAEHDLIHPREEVRDRRIAVRCFVDGRVTFQRSKFLGVGRHTRESDLLRSIRRIDAFAIVDFRAFPKVDIVEVPAAAIEAGVRCGLITKHGLTARRIDDFLTKNFRLSRVIVPDMPLGGHGRRIRDYDSGGLDRQREEEVVTPYQPPQLQLFDEPEADFEEISPEI